MKEPVVININLPVVLHWKQKKPNMIQYTCCCSLFCVDPCFACSDVTMATYCVFYCHPLATLILNLSASKASTTPPHVHIDASLVILKRLYTVAPHPHDAGCHNFYPSKHILHVEEVPFKAVMAGSSRTLKT